MAVNTLYTVYDARKNYPFSAYVQITVPVEGSTPVVLLYQALEPVFPNETPLTKTSKWNLITNSVSSTKDFDTNYNAGGVAPTLTPTGVEAGTYTNTTVTVDANGRITDISSGSGGDCCPSVDTISTSTNTPSTISTLSSVPTNTLIKVNSSIIGKWTGGSGSNGDSVIMDFKSTWYNNSGTLMFVGSSGMISIGNKAAIWGWAHAITGTQPIIRVVGSSSTAINWKHTYTIESV